MLENEKVAEYQLFLGFMETVKRVIVGNINCQLCAKFQIFPFLGSGDSWR